MKCEIDAKGTMTVAPETPMEAYALERWCHQAFVAGMFANPIPFIVKFDGERPHLCPSIIPKGIYPGGVIP